MKQLIFNNLIILKQKMTYKIDEKYTTSKKKTYLLKHKPFQKLL